MMPRMINTEAVILRRRDWKEADKLITLYSRDFGKWTARAIGSKKIQSKLGGHLEPFMRTDIHLIRSKTIDIIAGAKALSTYPMLRSTLPGMHVGQFLVETVDRLTAEAQTDPNVYALLTDTLDFLNQQSAPGMNFLVVQGSVLKMLARLGYEPNVSRCVHCATALSGPSMRFSADAGGGLHAHCAEADTRPLTVQRDTMKTLRLMLHAPLSTLNQLRVPADVWTEVNTCIDQSVRVHGQHEIHSRAFLGKEP